MSLCLEGGLSSEEVVIVLVLYLLCLCTQKELCNIVAKSKKFL